MRTLLLLSAVACNKDAVQASITPSPHVPTVGIVTIEGVEGTAFVEYGLEEFDQRTPDGELAVLGLKAGRTYKWRAVVVDSDGERHESEESTFDTPAPPPQLQPLQVTVADPSAETQYVLTASICSEEVASVGCSPRTGFAAIYDRDGDWVWWIDTGGVLIVTPELGLDGKSVAFSTYDFDKTADIGQMVRVSLDGRTRTETRMKMGHHDFVQHDDGTVAYLSLVFREFTLGGQDYRMASEAISVGPEGMTEQDTPTELFHMFDDFPLLPEATCTHITTPDVELGGEQAYEWTHGNSFMYVPEDDAYYVNNKFTDWLYKVDRATGQLQWILNGRGSDFTQPSGQPVWVSPSETTLWSHGHMSDIWSGGGLMFDNGDHYQPPLSRVVEFAWDETARTADVVWQFAHPGGDHIQALGDARRMPGGNVLVTWSGLLEVDEVTRDGTIVWQGIPQGDLLVGRVVPIADLYAP
jgi:hypothetical protein